MSLLFDQNLSRRLPVLLAAEFPGSEQVIAAGLASVTLIVSGGVAVVWRSLVTLKAGTTSGLPRSGVTW